MDTIQLLLIIILTITTILMIVVGVQLIVTLKEIRKSLLQTKKDHKLDNKQTQKDNTHKKNHLSIHAVMGRINSLSPKLNEKNKKFFIKAKH